jgi:hypothetical protein
MISAQELVNDGLAYLDSLSVDELEKLFTEVGLNPVRRTLESQSFSIETDMYTVVSENTIHTVFETSFSCNDDIYLDIAA